MSPKTLTGAELQLDDTPVRECELFLVDGNNLAYRAFFALPEELATSDGFSTNALLGFTNMLFKLLTDYRPKGVAVAWDSRAVHRLEISETYKSERRPMPDLLREQFPYFRPIVEAFGYRNLEFEGWEADDVIATLATHADEAGVRTCVVSTDRDAFQLVSENVCLMMTPRGVSDVHVYTPERVEARYGIRPDQIPDFIGLKGDTSDNIPGIPGIGDKTAGQLIAQYGALEAVIEHADELSPARRKNVVEFADQARTAKELATMRRDLELDCDPSELLLAQPDRSAYELDDLASEYGVEAIPEPAAEEQTAALVRAAELPLRLAAPIRARLRERGSEELYDRIELPLTAVLAAMEDAGIRIDTYRMGEITARLADRVEELEASAYELAGEEFMLGSTQQLARILFEKLALTPGRKGKTGYSTDTRVLRTIRHEHEIVGIVEEWRELTKLLNTYLGPLPSLISESDGRL